MAEAEKKIEAAEIVEPVLTAKKRGRPAGASVAKKQQADPDAAARQIAGLHAVVAMMTGLPELQLSERDAKSLAAALDNVQREFGFEIGGKAGAVIGLVATAAVVYVPRGIQIKARVEKIKREKAEAATVAAAVAAAEPVVE